MSQPMLASRALTSLMICAMTANLAYGAPRSTVTADLPKKPSIPVIPTPKAPTDAFRCDRYFVHEGKRLPCDSNSKADGEGLRAVIQDVPSALEELEVYQSNRSSLRAAAYMGTLGVLVLIGGLLLSRHYKDAGGNSTETSDNVATFSVLAGGGIAVGGFLYGVSSNKNNETHLGKAVELYNHARPKTPIQLQFTTSFDL